MPNSRKSRILIFALVIVVLVGAVHLITGVFDYIPRLRAQAISPDGTLTVKVYQKRLMPRPFFPRMGAVAKVYDRNGNLVYQNIFFRDSDFDDTLADAFKQISFQTDEIVIGPGFYDSRLVYIIQRSTMTGRYRPVPAI
jgi:hypothetical protein